jgi:hypothetical protein
MDNAREHLFAQSTSGGPYTIGKWSGQGQEEGIYPGRVHDGGFRDAKRSSANGPEPCWNGREEDPESQDVGIAVSCVFQVRLPSLRCTFLAHSDAGYVRMRRRSSALRAAMLHCFARLSPYHRPLPLRTHPPCKCT